MLERRSLIYNKTQINTKFQKKETFVSSSPFPEPELEFKYYLLISGMKSFYTVRSKVLILFPRYGSVRLRKMTNFRVEICVLCINLGYFLLYATNFSSLLPLSYDDTVVPSSNPPSSQKIQRSNSMLLFFSVLQPILNFALDSYPRNRSLRLAAPSLLPPTIYKAFGIEI